MIELQRLGVEVIAVDRYANAPGHQVAHRAHVIDMTDAKARARAGAEGAAASDRAGDRGDRDGRAGADRGGRLGARHSDGERPRISR